MTAQCELHRWRRVSQKARVDVWSVWKLLISSCSGMFCFKMVGEKELPSKLMEVLFLPPVAYLTSYSRYTTMLKLLSSFNIVATTLDFLPQLFLRSITNELLAS